MYIHAYIVAFCTRVHQILVKNRLYTIWSGTSRMYFGYVLCAMSVGIACISMYLCRRVPTLFYKHVCKLEQTTERQQIHMYVHCTLHNMLICLFEYFKVKGSVFKFLALLVIKYVLWN